MDTPLQNNYPSSPGLWRIAAAARACSMTVETFAQAVALGDIPCEIVEIGPRGFRFVRVSELKQFLKI